MKLKDRLPSKKGVLNAERHYQPGEFKRWDFKRGCLVVDERDFWVEFVLLEWAYSMDGEDWYEVVFHGEGAGGGLRECRHIYWGDGGYIYCPDGSLIREGLKALTEYFDF